MLNLYHVHCVLHFPGVCDLGYCRLNIHKSLVNKVVSDFVIGMAATDETVGEGAPCDHATHGNLHASWLLVLCTDDPCALPQHLAMLGRLCNFVCAFNVETCWGSSRQDQVEQIAKKLEGPLLVQKGAKDGISDGSQTIYCEGNGSKRRAGGQVCRMANTHLLGCKEFVLCLALLPETCLQHRQAA